MHGWVSGNFAAHCRGCAPARSPEGRGPGWRDGAGLVRSVCLGLSHLSFEGSNVLPDCSCSGSSREPECRGLLSLRPSLCVRSTSHCEEVFSLLFTSWALVVPSCSPHAIQLPGSLSLLPGGGSRCQRASLSRQPYPRPCALLSADHPGCGLGGSGWETVVM